MDLRFGMGAPSAAAPGGASAADGGLLHTGIGNLVNIGGAKDQAAAAAFTGAACADAGGAVIVEVKGVQGAVLLRTELYFLKTRRAIPDGERLVEAGEHDFHRRFG